MIKISFPDDSLQKLLWVAIVIVSAIVITLVLLFVNKKVFKAVGKKQKGLHLAFFEHLNRLIIIIGVFVIAISVIDSSSSVWKTLLGGTAVISAVVAFAAQDVLKDVLAGLMISLQKPFEKGDRIVLSDGTAGIVIDMTNRHVVLAGIDTTRFIVPNSYINRLMLINYSFKTEIRSASFKFPIGYDSDMQLAKGVILDAIKGCPHTIPGKKDQDGEMSYAGVYFMEFQDSSLLMQTTVYYENTVPTERLIDEVNTSVREALIRNGIEIPYNYVNVVNVSQ